MVTVMQILIGVLRTFPKRRGNRREEMEIRGRFKPIFYGQVRLEYSEIIERHEISCHSDSQLKTIG